jgi:hypothetical protein
MAVRKGAILAPKWSPCSATFQGEPFPLHRRRSSERPGAVKGSPLLGNTGRPPHPPRPESLSRWDHYHGCGNGASGFPAMAGRLAARRSDRLPSATGFVPAWWWIGAGNLFIADSGNNAAPPPKCRLLSTPVLQPQYCCRARRGVSKRCTRWRLSSCPLADDAVALSDNSSGLGNHRRRKRCALDNLQLNRR